MTTHAKQFSIVISAVALAITALPSAANAAGQYIAYKVKRGDTLLDFGKRYLSKQSDYTLVQKQNRIANPRFLSTGSTLQIDRSLLKYNSAPATVLSVRGNVIIAAANARVNAASGQTITEGVRITTSASSFITLQLADGSRISLPSNSDVTIRLMRTYVLGNSLDYDFAITTGGVRSDVKKHKSPDDRYRVRTPRAVSAVRGTDFQSRYNAEAGSDFIEVVEGGIEAGQTGSDPSQASSIGNIAAGNGVAVNQSGNVIREALLAEPNLINPGKIQADEELLFKVNPQSSANGYRYTLSSDAGFVDQISDVRAEGNEVRLGALDDGNYFIRSRAISANGIEGMPVTFGFKRRLNGVKASAGKGDDGYNFKWLGTGAGQRLYHFQLLQGSVTGTAIIDEAGLKSNQISISDLPPGDYFWRVGSVQFLDNEANSNWSEFEKLSVAP
jgi:hypothetical protein